MMNTADARLEVPSKAPPGWDPTKIALFLDLDGTLAPIEDEPGMVLPDEARTQVLRDLDTLMEGRVAVLSGRSIWEVDRILEGAVGSVAGEHGLERRGCGGFEHTPPHPGLDDATTSLERLARAQPGLLVERKGAAVAIHYRGKPDCGPAVIEAANRLAHANNLTLQEGRMVAELRTPGPDKGAALRAFMAEPPFSGARPIMIGDDLTDEHAFAAAIELGGSAILVGPPRPSLAPWRLPGPAALLAWLDRLTVSTRPLPLVGPLPLAGNKV